jgi:hypothetical protein
VVVVSGGVEDILTGGLVGCLVVAFVTEAIPKGVCGVGSGLIVRWSRGRLRGEQERDGASMYTNEDEF